MILNFWHASPDGEYDSKFFRYRGYQKTKSDGFYELITDFPGKYVGRTPHIHVKIYGGNKNFTTQLYFPGQMSNKSDHFYDRQLELLHTPQGFRFDFMINVLSKS